jgi:hypothetical protein
MLVKGFSMERGEEAQPSTIKRNNLLHKNSYEFKENYVIIIGFTRKKERFEILIDLEDFKKVKENSWCLSKKRKRRYAVSRINNKIVYIHQVILNYDGKVSTCDHKNMNGLDNRKLNLRVCSNQENNWNKPAPSTNKSGVQGVHWAKHCKRWCAQIKINNKTKHLGTFLTKEEAIAVRKEAEKLYRGEFVHNET